ncbi:MAG TPA: TetR/AcrR family transcriptional regulator [Longimicrobiaceae bacterium]|nr:TetR/AcrR family transcriptional regulator [Longimicrobiaceae bacterium]
MSGDSEATPIHVPRQARSRETLARLLDAAEAVLAEGGLEAATVPAIARRAGLSVGAVYRRFPDKDALLRAVYFRLFGRVREQNAARLDPELYESLRLETLLTAIVRGIVQHYREHRTLLQALQKYAESHADPEFRRRATELNDEALTQLAAVATAKRAEIRHPDPDAAVRFALLTIGLVLRGVVLREDRLPGRFLGDDVSLEEELTRMVLGYLGVEER